MSEELQRDEILSAGPDDGDWTEVVRRASRARRRQGIYGAVLLTALIAVGVASAYALGHPIVDFGTADKAPQKAVVEFGALDVSAPSNFTPGLIPDQAREIPGLYLNGKPFKLYVAPTKAGGFCGTVGGCIRNEAERRAAGEEILLSLSSGKSFKRLGDVMFDLTSGVFLNPDGDRIELSYADGSSDEIPFVWVGAPIDAGFYVFAIPEEHQIAENRPMTVTLYDKDGKVLASEAVVNMSRVHEGDTLVQHELPGYPHLSVPEQAIWEERRQLFDLRAENGDRLGLWVAPARGGGTCIWGAAGTGCNIDYRSASGKRSLGLVRFAGPEYVGLGGEVEADVVSVEARFQDGDVIKLEPRESYLLWLIPSEHFLIGHRLEKLIALDVSGKALVTQAMNPEEPGWYPCDQPKDYGYGVTMCP